MRMHQRLLDFHVHTRVWHSTAMPRILQMAGTLPAKLLNECKIVASRGNSVGFPTWESVEHDSRMERHRHSCEKPAGGSCLLDVVGLSMSVTSLVVNRYSL